MTEKVQNNLERRAVFYEELKNSGIYGEKNNMRDEDKLELKRFIKQEEAFEAKINGQMKNIDDFYEYIKLKKSLFARVTVRGKNCNPLKLQHLKYSITMHMKKLYMDGLTAFPNDLTLWDAYINFCKVTKCLADGSAAYEKMLTVHSDKPKCWLDAVQWECGETRDLEKAKSILLSAIEKHPRCVGLYLQLFKILLSTVNGSADYKLAIAVFENSKSLNFKVDFWVKLLEVAEEQLYTNILQEKIIGHMVKNYLHSEITWHILAQRELRGLETEPLIRAAIKPGTINPNTLVELTYENERLRTAVSSKYPLARCLKIAAEVYQTGLICVNTQQMWTYYIDAMLELHNEDGEEDLKQTLLENAFEGALKAGKISESHFCSYVILLKSIEASDKRQIEVIKRGPELFPNSTLPWEVYMSFYIIGSKEKEFNDVFKRAREVLGDNEKTYPLWRIYLRYYRTVVPNMEIVEKVFEETCRFPYTKFLVFRLHYLEHAMISKPVRKVRELYNRLHQLTPPYLDIHRRMARYEETQPKICVYEMRKCFKNAVQYFGHENTEVWIEYMNFEKTHGDPLKIPKIYDEATCIVKDKGKFISQYSLLNAMERFDLSLLFRNNVYITRDD